MLLFEASLTEIRCSALIECILHRINIQIQRFIISGDHLIKWISKIDQKFFELFTEFGWNSDIIHFLRIELEINTVIGFLFLTKLIQNKMVFSVYLHPSSFLYVCHPFGCVRNWIKLIGNFRDRHFFDILFNIINQTFLKRNRFFLQNSSFSLKILSIKNGPLVSICAIIIMNFLFNKINLS